MIYGIAAAGIAVAILLLVLIFKTVKLGFKIACGVALFAMIGFAIKIVLSYI